MMDVPGGAWSDPGASSLRELRVSWRNSSDARFDDLFPRGGRLLLLEVLMVLMCVGAVMGNILVIVIVVATKAFHSVTSVLIINLAISDFLVGIGVMPFVAVSLINDGWVNCADLCLYVGYTSSVYCTASVLTLAAIALDRYYSIVDCLRYDSRCTAWRTGVAVLWIWAQAALTSSPPLLGWSSVSFVQPMYSCAVNWANSPGYTVFMAIFSFVLPAGVILFCYVKIVRVARHHARRIHNLQEHFQSSGVRTSDLVCYVSGSFISTEEASRRLEGARVPRRLEQPQHHGILRLFLVIAAFFLCWTPYVGVALAQSVGRAPPFAVTFSYWLVLFNSDINPLLYALLSKRFQAALQNLRRKIRASLSERTTGEARVPGDTPGRERRVGSDRSTVFTVAAAFPRTEGSGEVLLPGSSSLSSFSTSSSACSLWNCSTNSLQKSEHLRVPSKPQERERVSTSATTERPATFFYGQITVRVEHEIC